MPLVDADDHRRLHRPERFGLAREVLRRPVADDLHEHAASRRDQREVRVEQPRAHPHDGVLTRELPPRAEAADVRREPALHAAVGRSGQRMRPRQRSRRVEGELVSLANEQDPRRE